MNIKELHNVLKEIAVDFPSHRRELFAAANTIKKLNDIACLLGENIESILPSISDEDEANDLNHNLISLQAQQVKIQDDVFSTL